MKLHRSCLLVSILIGFEHIKYLRNLDSNYKSLSYIDSEVSIKQKSVLKKLYPLYSDAVNKSGPLTWTGPHNLESCADFLDQIQCQVHILTLNPKTCHVESYPEENQPARDQIYLLTTSQEEESHVDLILRPKSFFRKHGEYCIHCGRTASMAGSYRHVCNKKGAQCSACRRPYLNEGDKIHPDLSPAYCLSKITPKETVNDCSKCNKQFLTKECKQNHTLAVCRRGFRCPKCNKNFACRGESDRIERMNSHKCNSVKCSICHTFYLPTEAHWCPLSKSKNQKNHPNLALLSICYSSMKCLDGRDTYLEPNMCVLFAEESERSTYQGMSFGLNHESDLDEMALDKYTPDDLIESCKYNCRGRKIGFNNEMATPENFHFPQEHNKVMIKLFKYMLVTKKTQYKNMTIVVPSAKDLVPIASITSLIGHCEPNIMNKGTKLMSIHIPCMNMTFMSQQNYTNLNMDSLRKRYRRHGDPLFFPEQLCNYKNHDYEGLPPKAQFYYKFGDSEIVQALKEKYSQSFPTNYKWNFWKELERFLVFECLCLGKAIIKYVKEVITLEKHCQERAHVKPKLKGGDANYFHPITQMTPSNSSAVYYLFKRYFLDHHNIKAVKHEYTGVPTNNASLMEMEYTSFLIHENSAVESVYNMAYGMRIFNPPGKPDAYDPISRKVHFFHGCLVSYSNLYLYMR